MNQELERQPRLADVEARVGDLQRQLEDLRDEIRKVCLAGPTHFSHTFPHSAPKIHSTMPQRLRAGN